MADMSWFDAYQGRYTQSDLTEENLEVQVRATYDELASHVEALAHLLDNATVPPHNFVFAQPELWPADATHSRIGQAIRRVWHIAQHKGTPRDENVSAAIEACIDILRVFSAPGTGPVTIWEVDNDSPLLFAWLETSRKLWSKGLERAFLRGHFRVDYRPSTTHTLGQQVLQGGRLGN